VLIVSDNAELTNFFQKEVARQEVCSFADFDYGYSITNKDPDPMKELGAAAVDIKDQSFCAKAKVIYGLIVSIHSKRIFPPDLVNSVTCVNFHPGFNPFNRGWYPQVFSLINKDPIGATLHVMDAEIDHGAIIDQVEVAIRPTDTSSELYARVIDAENH